MLCHWHVGGIYRHQAGGLTAEGKEQPLGIGYAHWLYGKRMSGRLTHCYAGDCVGGTPLTSPLILQLLVCKNPLATDEYSPGQIVQHGHFHGLREERYTLRRCGVVNVSLPRVLLWQELSCNLRSDSLISKTRIY